MIPTIEDIFHLLSRGEMSFDTAEAYVREHIRLAANSEVKTRDVFAGMAMNACMLNSSLPYSVEHAALHAKRAYQQADAMLEARKV